VAVNQSFYYLNFEIGRINNLYLSLFFLVPLPHFPYIRICSFFCLESSCAPAVKTTLSIFSDMAGAGIKYCLPYFLSLIIWCKGY
jgi:hypothetical protein